MITALRIIEMNRSPNTRFNSSHLFQSLAEWEPGRWSLWLSLIIVPLGLSIVATLRINMLIITAVAETASTLLIEPANRHWGHFDTSQKILVAACLRIKRVCASGGSTICCFHRQIDKLNLFVCNFHRLSNKPFVIILIMSVSMALTQETPYLTLLALAEGFRTAIPPDIPTTVQCLMAILNLPNNDPRVVARTHLQIGKLISQHTTNIDVALNYLEKAVSFFARQWQP